MAPATGGSNGKKHLQCRISYLHRAAAYLTDLQYEASRSTDKPQQMKLQDPNAPGKLQGLPRSMEGNTAEAQAQLTLPDDKTFEQSKMTPTLSPLARHLISDLQSISKKSLIRLESSVKHTICKKCQSYLKSGHNMTSAIENKSRGGKKPWASVRVDTCSFCNAQKRFPINAERQPRRKNREQRVPTARSEEASKGKPKARVT